MKYLKFWTFIFFQDPSGWTSLLSGKWTAFAIPVQCLEIAEMESKLSRKWHPFNLIYRNWKFWLCYQIIWLENFNINGIEFNDSEICRCISDAFFFSHLIWFNFLFLKNENMNIFLIKALAALYTPSMLCGF